MDDIHLNNWGAMVADEWMKIQTIRQYISLDKFIVMPNHIHGIIVIKGKGMQYDKNMDICRGTARRAPTEDDAWRIVPARENFAQPVPGSLPTIIRSFKSAVTKRINELPGALGIMVWQRNYYEHIIRTREELLCIREYIRNNPANWNDDEENPLNR